MTLENDAELVVGNGITMTVTNPATVKRNMGSLFAWHYFCYPVTVSNTKFFLTSPQSNYVKWYNEPNNAWHYIGTIQPDSAYSNKPAYGYALWATTSTAYSFTGIVNNGSISTPVTRTNVPSLGDFNGWNLVGNPYPCSLDLSTVTGWTNLEPWAYFWHPGEGSGSSGYTGGNYDVYGGGLIPNGATTHSQYAPALQGFFVKVTSTGSPSSGTYHVDNGNRVFSSEAWLKSQESGAYFIKFEVLSSINGSTDRASVYFNPLTSPDYNENEDAEKLTGSNGAPQLYTTASGIKLTIQGLPIQGNAQVVPMGFSCTLAGSYTLTASDLASFNEGVTVSLEDLKTNTTQDLLTNPVYTFSYESTDSPDRFLLLFSNLYTGVEKKNVENLPVQMYSYNSSVYIRSTNGKVLAGNAFIYDLMGRELYNGQLVPNTLNTINPVISEGYYVVKVVTADGVYTQKIYLK
jgi:hypothetical protein